MQEEPSRPRRSGAASVILCVARHQDTPIAAAHGLLSAAELERARRVTHHGAWLQFVLTRGLLRLLLGHCTGRPPRSFAIDADDGRAPCLVDNPWRLHFNVSHGDEYAAIAIGHSPLGIDIERIDPDCDWETIAETCFHADEQMRLRHTPKADRLATFFEIWTRKEAYLKGVGTGLSNDPALFSTARDDGVVAPLQCAAPSALTWYTQPIAAPAGYQCALASPFKQLSITCVDAAMLLGNLRPAARFAPGQNKNRAAPRMPGTNRERRVTYRGRHRFARADDTCRFGAVEECHEINSGL